MNVLFFGDSICNGQGIAIHKGWVTRLSQSLNELASQYGQNVVVINASVNGRTTRQALESMPYEVQQQGPKVMIVQFGMNDCNIWESDRGNPRVSPLAFEANLREIIQRAWAFGAETVFLNTNHPTGRNQNKCAHSSVTYEEQNSFYNSIIRQVAKTTPAKVRLNDIEAAFYQYINDDRNKLLSLLLPDLLHLSEKGHDLYHDIVHGPITTCIQQLLNACAAA